MSHDPTPAQALLLFGLIARHGECAQAELMPAVKKADREALAKAKLLSVGKLGRGLKLQLEDAGWAWTAAHLGAELPLAQRTLSDVLVRLGEHLARSGETLANFIGAKPEDKDGTAGKAAAQMLPARTTARAKEPGAKTPLNKGASRGKTTKPTSAGSSARSNVGKARAPTAAALRKRVEAAYLAITGDRKNETVRLSRLRAELADLDRATVDIALSRILKGDSKAALMRHDDPHQLTQADHDAAFNPHGEPFHVLWIAS